LLLERIVTKLRNNYQQKFDIAEPFFISDVYKTLQIIPGVIDVISVKITQKTGANYSDSYFDIESRTDVDGRFIDVPQNVIMEIKYPDTDIVGAVK